MKKLNLYLFGIGNVGKTLLNQIFDSKDFLEKQNGLQINLIGISNSSRMLVDLDGIGEKWEQRFVNESVVRTPDGFYRNIDLDSINIAVDATASKELSEFYEELVSNGFHIASANKIANTFDQERYDEFRKILANNEKRFEYETNVGAGLPVIETLRNLVASGEQITQVKGVFSGSLGYLFYEYSKRQKSFSEILKDALAKGFTEPDPREDLSGNDVARKLLILAREIGLKKDLSDVSIENLVPKQFSEISKNEFLDNLDQLDFIFHRDLEKLDDTQVLRHTGVLNAISGNLEVKLEIVERESALGQLEGSDGFFEIYSNSYVHQPLIIKGAGAGPEVTARGLLSDVIKIAATVEAPVLI